MSKLTIKRPEYSGTSTPGEFFGRLMQITGKAHLSHLRQFNLSGWEHKALNTLYEDVVDTVDTIIESYQGIYGLVNIVIPETFAERDSIAFVQNLYNYIMSARVMFKESWLQNEIDNICTLLAQTLYRLKYVK